MPYDNIEMARCSIIKTSRFFHFFKNCPKPYHLPNKSHTNSIFLQQNARSCSTLGVMLTIQIIMSMSLLHRVH